MKARHIFVKFSQVHV